MQILTNVNFIIFFKVFKPLYPDTSKWTNNTADWSGLSLNNKTLFSVICGECLCLLVITGLYGVVGGWFGVFPYSNANSTAFYPFKDNTFTVC